MPYQPPELIAAQRLYDQRLPPEDPQDVPGEDVAYFLEEMSRLKVKRIEKEEEK